MTAPPDLNWYVMGAVLMSGAWWGWVRRYWVYQERDAQQRRTHLLNQKKALTEKALHHERLVEDVVRAMRQPAQMVQKLNASLRARNDLTPDVTLYLTQVFDAAAHLQSIVNDLLDPIHNRAQDALHVLRVQLTDCDVRAVVHTACDLFAHRCESLGLSYACEIDSNVPEQWLTDANRLKQVLINLVGNAVKFTQQGHIALRVTANAHQITFEVEDTGIGIAPHQQALLFQRFSQAHQNIHTRYGGHGLGLAISRQLVEQLGGQMGMVSVLGQGSRFWFSLPRNPLISED